MKSMFKQTLLAGAVAALCLSGNQLLAQNPPPGGPGGGGPGRGNFDPAQMQQRMMERYKEMLEFTSDDEWKAVQPFVQKVTEARRDVGFGGMGRGMMGGARRGGDNAQQGGQQGDRPRGFGGGEPSAAVQELQKAVDSKASADEIKGKLAKVREERKQKEAALTKAQDDLRKVLNARREAQAVLAGLLN